MRWNRALWSVTGMLAGTWLLAGCGYRAGFLIPADIRSVNVQVASNKTFWREAVKVDNLDPDAPAAEPRPAYPMTVQLTERLKNEIVRRTPLKLRGENEADSVLETTISKVALGTIDRDAQDNVTAARVSIEVDFVWRDQRNGRILAQKTGITRPTYYYVKRRESLATAAHRSFDYIAEQIVEAMQEGF